MLLIACFSYIAIDSFESAKKCDVDNEKLPPVNSSSTLPRSLSTSSSKSSTGSVREEEIKRSNTVPSSPTTTAAKPIAKPTPTPLPPKK